MEAHQLLITKLEVLMFVQQEAILMEAHQLLITKLEVLMFVQQEAILMEAHQLLGMRYVKLVCHLTRHSSRVSPMFPFESYNILADKLSVKI